MIFTVLLAADRAPCHWHDGGGEDQFGDIAHVERQEAKTDGHAQGLAENSAQHQEARHINNRVADNHSKRGGQRIAIPALFR